VFRGKEKSKVFGQSFGKYFGQYNVAIFTIFTLITFIIFSLTTFGYFYDLSAQKKLEIQRFTNQVNKVNNALALNANTLLSMQKFANYQLSYPNNLVNQMPELIQQGENYFSKNQPYDVLNHKDYVRGNISGIGDINSLDKSLKAELAMANMLTPAFVATKAINTDLVWFYYVSKKRFVSIYPSVNQSSWQYNDALLSGEHIKSLLINEVKSTNNKQKIAWSTPYVGSVDVGLNSSVSIGIYDPENVVGVLNIDINLSKIRKKFNQITSENEGVLILNDKNEVLIHHDFSSKVMNKIAYWQNITPKNLATLTNDEVNNLPFYQEVGNWLILKQELPVNGWRVIKYKAYQDFAAPLLTFYSKIFIFFLCILFILLCGIYWFIHRTFVKPTKRFISHIEYCAEGDPGKIKPTADWLKWFQIVENIFGQNRSLLQRLTDQNSLLDARVNEKTQELQEKIIQHKRDYALLRSVMDAIPEYILFNDIDGNIVGFNNAFEHYIGKNEQAIIGHKAFEIIDNQLGSALTKISTSKNVKNGLNQLIYTDKHTYDIYSTYIYSDSGIEVGTINIIRDVTTQYAIQAALENTKNQAEFANKAKSQFLANMSHEIRTPINAIQGMITLLGRSDLTNNQRQHIENAYGASKSLLYLVDQLLDLAKIEAGEMTMMKENVNLDALINKTMMLNVGQAAQKGLSILVDIGDNVPVTINTDEMRLIQVLTNLLQNSVKFTQKGTITLSVEVLQHNTNNMKLRFKIIDTGIGIALHKQSHLFEAFKQADESMTRQYGGSGLGLSICQQIVELLDGNISLKSDLNQGCEFTIDLPFKVSQQAINQTAVQSLTLYNYDVILPESLLKSIKAQGWKYKQLSALSEITDLHSAHFNSTHANSSKSASSELLTSDTSTDLAKYSNKYANKKLPEDIVLLTSEENLHNIANSSAQKLISLVCVCQTTGYNLSAYEAVLEQLTVPYILQEQPLYRYMLTAIEQSIQRHNKAEIFATKKQNVNLKDIVVLLVEDNIVNQLVAKELLINMKAEVIIAENGRVALDLLEKNPIDVVLMDIQMPVMDGLTATTLIRQQERFSTLPIIAMTAHAREEDKNNSLAAGMNIHMAKPVEYNTLLNTILTLINKNSYSEIKNEY